MPNEILIYSDVTDRSASDFINQVNEADSDERLVVRISTDGGDPTQTFGMVSKFLEFAGDKLVKIDGKAYSAGFFFACYVPDVESLDVSQFLIHRAAYNSWFETSEYFTEALRGNLVSINKDLETAFRNKIDVAVFEEMKGVKVKEIFSMEDRKDVFLTAKEAKKIGLISKINKITPSKKKKIEAGMMKIAAKYNLKIEDIKPEVIEANNNNNPKKISMNIDKLKAEHPGVYAAVLALGVDQEFDRVGSWNVFIDVDTKAVAEGIKSGKTLSATQMAEFTMKSVSKETLVALKGGNADPILTDAEVAAKAAADALVDKGGKLTPAEELEAKLEKELNIKLN